MFGKGAAFQHAPNRTSPSCLPLEAPPLLQILCFVPDREMVSVQKGVEKRKASNLLKRVYFNLSQTVLKIDPFLAFSAPHVFPSASVSRFHQVWVRLRLRRSRVGC